MNLRKESKIFFIIIAVFLGCYFLPVGLRRFDHAVLEALALVKWYAREHVLLCLIPAFLIAGGIGVFISKDSVMKYLGPRSNKLLAYGVASVSGSILAVCSCTVMPLFAGIYRMGAGLGPACAFLYSGPAINVLAIILTARVLGLELGIARAIGAIGFSVILGILMHLLFLKDERERTIAQESKEPEKLTPPLWQRALFFALLIGILVFANWLKPIDATGIWYLVYSIKWWITGILILGLIVFLALFYSKKELAEWMDWSWWYAKQLLPLLLAGVFIAGLLLGRPGHEGLFPSDWVETAVGGNSLQANFFASLVGALMYFATLTEVPILQALMGAGMGKGPALALLLAGPSLSLPNMIIIYKVLGIKKTVAFVFLVVIMATVSGVTFGAL